MRANVKKPGTSQANDAAITLRTQVLLKLSTDNCLLMTDYSMALLTVVLAGALVLLTGCASLRPRQPVPAALVEQAQIPGMPGVRMLLHPLRVDMAQIDHSLTNANPRAAGRDRPLTLLALSGGGADGAYGAGVLCGWTAAGDRPEFDIVTGISTGALIGPYAFLGAACDAELKQNYTTISDKDICKKRGAVPDS